MMDERYCADVSREAGEPIIGQALSADLWFLLEVNRPWGAQATTDNDLPPQVRAWLADLTAAVPNSRLQFIRQQAGGALTLFIGAASEAAPRLYRFEARRYADLFALDVAAVASGDPAFEAHRWREPIYLVCTNGKRDRCCARYGAATYRALQARVGRAAWQTTHTGGHRFAPNLIAFPEGVFYSRVFEADVPAFLDAVQQGELPLPFYRGHACYTPVEQAAAFFARRESGVRTLDGLRHLFTVEEDGQVRVQFADAAERVYEVRVAIDTAVPAGILASCGKPQLKPVPSYRLLRYEAKS